MIIKKNGKTYKLVPSDELGGYADGWVEVECTCTNCQNNKDCPFAYDDYNVNGDCLLEH